MRLIDADALFDAYEKSGWYNNADRDEIAERLLFEQPTIDAIPIEFIQKRIDQLKEMNERIFIANGGYTSPSDYEQWELERLIRDWREHE